MTLLQRRTLLAAGGGVVLAGCSATGALNALVPNDTYRVEQDIAYGAQPRQRLDVYRPREPLAADAPLVVFFYGGSWSRGERGDYRFVGEALASAGIVTVIPDYRLSPQVLWQEILRDCAAAADWAAAQAPRLGASARRLHLMGHSAGAYNAAMLALDPRWLQPHGRDPQALAGWIGVAGPYDFLPIGDPATRRAFGWPDTPRESQPVVHVGPQAPRTLLLAARDDRTVDPERNSGGLSARLRQAGVPVRLRTFDGVNHVTVLAALAAPLRRLAPVREEVLQFLRAP